MKRTPYRHPVGVPHGPVRIKNLGEYVVGGGRVRVRFLRGEGGEPDVVEIRPWYGHEARLVEVTRLIEHVFGLRAMSVGIPEKDRAADRVSRSVRVEGPDLPFAVSMTSAPFCEPTTTVFDASVPESVKQ